MKQRFAQVVKVVQFWPQRQHVLLSDLTSLIEDGVSLSKALDTISQIYDGITKKVIDDMRDAIAQGHLLASGMERWFPQTIVEIVRAGEEGGTFDAALQSAVAYYKEQVFVIKMALQSMLYPLMVVCVALVMLVVIKNSVLVNFAQIKPITQWPAIGQNLFQLANIIQYWWWFILFVMIASVVGLAYFLQNVTGDMRQFVDHMPILSLYRRLAAARFMETLGLLASNGVPLKKAFQIMHQHASPYMSWHLMLMEFRLGGGKENIADVLDTQLLQKDDMLRLRVIASGKRFDEALISLGRQALTRYSQSVSITVKVLGGIMLVVGAMLAAMIVFGIYSVGSMVAA